jgi:hypothetical protein
VFVGMPGHTPALIACNACCSVHIPDACVVLGSTGAFVIILPG